MAQDTIKCYDTPSDVVAALAEDFIAFTNEEISRIRNMHCRYHWRHSHQWFVRDIELC